MTDEPYDAKPDRATRADRKPARKVPRKATSRYLNNAARFYLERYATSVAGFRAYLLRKVDASAREHGTSPEEGREEIERLVELFTNMRALDDQRFAEQRAGSLHRKGKAKRAIAQDLKTKGISEPLIQKALESLQDGDEAIDPDFQAAVRYARKKGFGPFAALKIRSLRSAELETDEQETKKIRQRSLAAFARQGFSLSLAERILNSEDPHALEEEAGL
ncbi:regulatory protein RecX [Kiloniella sp. b19]|uniref:regulatory protein RecX n=1 Tax=Kiloniella sp. GXU_MW_B19 TaxID=3141326 RepID=UPI0031D64FEB